jgi:hypothetical protein
LARPRRVKYVGKKYVIFDGKDQFVEEKLQFKRELVKIL